MQDADTVHAAERSSAARDAGFVAAMLLLALVRNGVGVLPTRKFYATTFVHALPDVPRLHPFSQWALWSPIGPIASRLVGIESVRGFVVLHVVVALAGFAVLVVGVRRRYGSLAMRVAVVAFVALPVSVVLQSWFGSYDAWVFLLSTAIVVTVSPTVAAAAGFALAFANFEQSLFIVALLAMVAVLGLHGSWRRCAYAAAGLVVGRITLGIWLHHNGVRYGRIDYQRHLGTDYLLSAARRSWLLLLLSLVGAAVVLVWNVFRGGRLQSYAMLIVLLLPILPMLLGADETRVYALTTWPALLALMIGETVRAPERMRRTILPTIVLSVIVPAWFVWDGRPYLADQHWIRLVWLR